MHIIRTTLIDGVGAGSLATVPTSSCLCFDVLRRQLVMRDQKATCGREGKNYPQDDKIWEGGCELCRDFTFMPKSSRKIVVLF